MQVQEIMSTEVAVVERNDALSQVEDLRECYAPA